MSILDFLSGGHYGAADANMARAMDELSRIKAPTLEELRVQYETLKSQGQLTPELEQAFQQQASEMENVSTDPRLKQAQLAALSKLGEIGEDGMTLSDEANLQKIQSQVGQQERGSREAILTNMARRGQGGSGVELAAMLSNQQGAAERAASGGLDIQAEAQDRALNAIMQAGDLGGSIRSQDFAEQSAKATAADEINRFNTMNKQNVVSNNVNRTNDSKQFNLQNTQNIMNQNTGIRNAQIDANRDANQAVFDNKFKVAGARSGVLQNQAQNNTQRGQQEQAFWGNLISGAATAYGAKK